MSNFAKRMVAAAVVVAATLAVSGQVMADCQYCGGGGFNGARGFGYSGTLYGLGYIPVPPYHAIHPPVYYGQRVRRSYGRSPYAQRPARAQVQKAKPRVVVNATMKKEAAPAKPAEKPTALQSASRPKMIINPFVAEGKTAGRFVAGEK